jgi:hypothetical protein
MLVRPKVKLNYRRIKGGKEGKVFEGMSDVFQDQMEFLLRTYDEHEFFLWKSRTVE